MPPQAMTRNAINPNSLRDQLRFRGTATVAISSPVWGRSLTFFRTAGLMAGRSPRFIPLVQIIPIGIFMSTGIILASCYGGRLYEGRRGGSNDGRKTTENRKRISAG